MSKKPTEYTPKETSIFLRTCKKAAHMLARGTDTISKDRVLTKSSKPFGSEVEM